MRAVIEAVDGMVVARGKSSVQVVRTSQYQRFLYALDVGCSMPKAFSTMLTALLPITVASTFLPCVMMCLAISVGMRTYQQSIVMKAKQYAQQRKKHLNYQQFFNNISTVRALDNSISFCRCFISWSFCFLSAICYI